MGLISRLGTGTYGSYKTICGRLRKKNLWRHGWLSVLSESSRGCLVGSRMTNYAGNTKSIFRALALLPSESAQLFLRGTPGALVRGDKIPFYATEREQTAMLLL